MAKKTPSFEFTQGYIQDMALFHAIGNNYRLLPIICYVVYATMGLILELLGAVRQLKE
jgi:hypothetical protein